MFSLSFSCAPPTDQAREGEKDLGSLSLSLSLSPLSLPFLRAATRLWAKEILHRQLLFTFKNKLVFFSKTAKNQQSR